MLVVLLATLVVLFVIFVIIPWTTAFFTEPGEMRGEKETDTFRCGHIECGVPLSPTTAFPSRPLHIWLQDLSRTV